MQDASTAGDISSSGVAGSFKDKTGWESVKSNFKWDTTSEVLSTVSILFTHTHIRIYVYIYVYIYICIYIIFHYFSMAHVPTDSFQWFQWSQHRISARKVAKAIGPPSTPLGAGLKVHVASLHLRHFGCSAWTVTLLQWFHYVSLFLEKTII